MLHDALIELYTNNGVLNSDFTIDLTPTRILHNLSLSGIKFTWETTKEEKINSHQSVIEVRVYLPGHIVYGRHIYKTETEALEAHLYAICNAIESVVCGNKINNQTSKSTQQEQPQQTTQPLSQEEILNMVQQESVTSKKITTAEQFEKDPREEIPFEDVDMDLDELDKLLSGKAASKVYEEERQAQQPVSHGFTQNQINAINEFKQRLNITNDAMLGNYINSWNNKLSKKEDLTPDNIDSFIEWTQTVGKAPC